jgi:hypothetical protein
MCICHAMLILREVTKANCTLRRLIAVQYQAATSNCTNACTCVYVYAADVSASSSSSTENFVFFSISIRARMLLFKAGVATPSGHPRQGKKIGCNGYIGPRSVLETSNGRGNADGRGPARYKDARH